MTDNYLARMFKCQKCHRRFPRFYFPDSTVITVACPRCGRTAQVNIKRLVDVPAALQAAVAEAGKANGIVEG